MAERFAAARSAAEAVLSSESALPLAAQVASAGLALLAMELRDGVAATQQYSVLRIS